MLGFRPVARRESVVDGTNQEIFSGRKSTMGVQKDTQDNQFKQKNYIATGKEQGIYYNLLRFGDTRKAELSSLASKSAASMERKMKYYYFEIDERFITRYIQKGTLV